MRPSPPVALALLAIILLAPAGWVQPVSAQPADDGLTVVRAAYDILRGQFYRPLDNGALLAAGWSSLAAAAADGGLPKPQPLAQLPEDGDEAFAVFAAAYRAYLAFVPADVSSTDIAFAVVAGMARSLQEGHTFFLGPSEYRAFLDQLGGDQQPVGLGLTTTTRAPWVVRAVAADGPAAHAGIERGDLIVAVDGRPMATASPAAFAEAVGGPQGAAHQFTLDRRGSRLDATVTRAPYYFSPLESRMIAGDVGYLRIDSFPVAGVRLPDGTEFLSDLDHRLDALEAAGARGLILDLRDNPGGLVFTAAEVLGRFLPADARTIIYTDARGREVTGLAGGRPRDGQLPMVVLIDKNTASAAEIVASTLREHGRALLVGERSAGLLAAALLQPLPTGTGLNVAVASVLSARGRVPIDGDGVAVDIEAPAASAEDEQHERDPMLDAALAALAQSPALSAPAEHAGGRSASEVSAAVAHLLPAPGQIPTNDRLGKVERLSTRDFTQVNQWINYNGPAHDPGAVQAALRARGWQGSHVQEYGAGLLQPPGLSISADLYATVEGAADALATNDFPELYERVASPATLGEGNVAYRGQWLGQGSLSLSWRRGAIVFSVGYFDVPGHETWDTALAAARLVDEAYVRDELSRFEAALDRFMHVP